jgi:hypothetical protein
MNGHFAAVGEGPAAGQYEHGIQVIDEDKQFKYVFRRPSPLLDPLGTYADMFVQLECQ